MTTTTSDTTTVQGAPRRVVDDAWHALNRRYAIGAGVLAAALALLWALGVGPGAWRGAQPGADVAPRAADAPAPASRDAAVAPAATRPSAAAGDTPATAAAKAGAAAPAPRGGATAGAPAGGGDPPAAARGGPATGNGAPATDAATAPRALPGAPVARLYFEPDQAWPSGEIGPRLAPVLARLKAEPDTKALVSGFHDRRGSVERNAALALRRAQAVRRALIREGIPAARIVLAKPQQTQGSGPDREARRVEVTVAR